MHRLLYTTTALCVLVAAVSVITHSANDVIGTTTTAPARHYYLTKAVVNGNAAKTACASGYHFASFAELGDLSNITNNKTLGRVATDDGFGPPSLTLGGSGWIRTGYASNSVTSGSTITPTNCSGWTSASGADLGERMFFSPSANPQTVISNNNPCDNSNLENIGVWCIQN